MNVRELRVCIQCKWECGNGATEVYFVMRVNRGHLLRSNVVGNYFRILCSLLQYCIFHLIDCMCPQLSCSRKKEKKTEYGFQNGLLYGLVPSVVGRE